MQWWDHASFGVFYLLKLFLLFFADNQFRDQRANKLMPGNSYTTKFPLTNDATGETIPVTVYDYFTKISAYKAQIKYPKYVLVNFFDKS